MGPDPASRAISTVGGNIATGAGGLLCAKYGVVRDAVLGVDLVLADGRLLHLGHRSVKGVTGLDLTSLVIDPRAHSAWWWARPSSSAASSKASV